jgi:hypothetical protein
MRLLSIALGLILVGPLWSADTPKKRALPPIAPKAKVISSVLALAYSPDGQHLAAAVQGAVLLFDAKGTLVQQLASDRDRVTALGFDPKGRFLAVACGSVGEQWEVRLWKLEAGKLVGSPTITLQHEDIIHDLAFNPAGSLLATASYDRLVKLWDLTANKASHELKDHSDSVYGVSFHPDGKLVASVGADRAIKVWDTATGVRLYTLSEATDWLYCVAWSPDKKHLAAAGVDRSVRIWQADAKDGRIIHSAFAHEGAVLRLGYNSDGKTFYTMGEDGIVKVWESASCRDLRTLPKQSATLMSFALRGDEKELALGAFEGSLVRLDAMGKLVSQLLPQKEEAKKDPPKKESPKSEAKPAVPVVDSITPTTLARGQTIELRVQGKNLSEATLVGIQGQRLANTATEAVFKISVPMTQPLADVVVRVKTIGGESAPRNLAVARFAPTQEVELNDSAQTGQPIKTPTTVLGSLGKPGDVDWFRFEAKAGEQLGVQVIATTAQLSSVLKLAGPDGSVVAESTTGLLGVILDKPGTWALGVRDLEYRGGAEFGYRLEVGPVPVVTAVFPMGLQKGTSRDVTISGVNLSKFTSAKITVPMTAAVGSRVPIPVPPMSETPVGMPTLLVGEYPEITSEDKERAIATPGTANGVISSAGQKQTWKFAAKKGERVILEVDAARKGSNLDSTLEILDATGRPLPRALLRAQAKTVVVFRDHDSRVPGIRMEAWSELAVNDMLLVNNELMKIRALPRNPDDDCQFFQEQGRRMGWLGTTPGFHTPGTPMYKVTIHPPGSTFAPNGLPITTLLWRNDDGHDTGKDSKLIFDAPETGSYQVRVGDSRGEGSSAHWYRLHLRLPNPDFSVSVNMPGSVNKGGAVPVRVNLNRADEFAGEVDVELKGLPAGFHAPKTNIPSDDNSTAFSLYAEPGAKMPEKMPTLTIEARGTIAGKSVLKTATATLPKPIEPGDLVTTTKESEVIIKPGGETRVTVNIERRNGFTGRVPVDVQGLPHGVRVLDVGLNGILIIPTETTRTFVLYCEPWVKPMKHPIVVLTRREGKADEYAAKSVMMEVK